MFWLISEIPAHTGIMAKIRRHGGRTIHLMVEQEREIRRLGSHYLYPRAHDPGDLQTSRQDPPPYKALWLSKSTTGGTKPVNTQAFGGTFQTQTVASSNIAEGRQPWSWWFPCILEVLEMSILTVYPLIVLSTDNTSAFQREIKHLLCLPYMTLLCFCGVCNKHRKNLQSVTLGLDWKGEITS